MLLHTARLSPLVPKCVAFPTNRLGSRSLIPWYKANATVLSLQRFELWRYSTAATESEHVAAAVVGGGPAGLAVMGNLLERFDAGKILWVDPYFNGGRIHRKYREVPSNTRANLFVGYAKAVEPFRHAIASMPTPNAITRLEELPQDQTCSLHHAADMLQMLTGRLRQHARVKSLAGRVTEAEWDGKASRWSLNTQLTPEHPSQRTTTPLLVLCTGSHPITIANPISHSQNRDAAPAAIDLDDALQPSLLATRLPRDHPTTIGVLGASHSAILVLMNLITLAQSTHSHLRVRWLARRSTLRYAEDMPGGWIRRDNTGLKGRAADFARAELEGDKLDASAAGRVVRRVDCGGGEEAEREVLARELPRCAFVVQAVGYAPNALPTIRRRGGREVEVEFDHETGGFREKGGEGKRVPGLYGAGIAFPERVVDPEGNVEYAVGLWKFMKFLKRVVPAWGEADSYFSPHGR